ncbi:hypothetical protein LUZ60_011913 [Juncus effusus]|nr:hypothetical protein LUZ60_011913 [Juncus effusus]
MITRILLITFIGALMRKTLIGATDYTVGDSEGWTIGQNYLAWAQKYNFTVGDTLLFNYVPKQHNVYEVTKDAFKSCNATNETLHIYKSGSDMINLTQSTEYFFICNIKDHCGLGGMKFSINVSEPPPPPPPPPPPLLFPSPPPPPNLGLSRGLGFDLVFLVVSLWYVLFL